MARGARTGAAQQKRASTPFALVQFPATAKCENGADELVELLKDGREHGVADRRRGGGGVRSVTW